VLPASICISRQYPPNGSAMQPVPRFLASFVQRGPALGDRIGFHAPPVGVHLRLPLPLFSQLRRDCWGPKRKSEHTHLRQIRAAPSAADTLSD
jgi:hypothetical protein